MDANNVAENGAVNGKNVEHAPEKTSKVREFFKKRWFLLFLLFLLLFVIVSVVFLLVFLIPYLRRDEVERDFRLPLNLLPEHYFLEVQPHLDPDKLKFEGHVTITFVCVNSTDTIILHGKDLDVSKNEVDVTSDDGDFVFNVLKIHYDLDNEFIIFTLCENLKAGERYRIHMKYVGHFLFWGFFVRKYEENGVEEYMAATKFERTHARRAFPCFDEIGIKATFTISIVRRKKYVSLSNMPILETKERDEDWEVDRYQTTPVMSTYIVAFAVGDFKRIQKERVSLWFLKKGNTSDFILNSSHKLLKYFEEYFYNKYDLPKLDQLIVPEYASAGNENWGLIMYNEANIASEDDLQGVERLVSHEIIHQWFGNLVTPKWWDELWLKEGFSRYLEKIGLEYSNPKWRTIENFVLNTGGFKNSDCHERMEPIKFSISKADDLQNHHGQVYWKAGITIRMLHLILGDDAFRKGLSTYLRKNAYGSADQEELWKHFNQAQTKKPSFDVKKMMEPWISQASYPIITVVRDYSKKTTSIAQTSCLNYVNKNSNALWNVPITLMNRYSANQKVTVTKWLTGKNAIVRDDTYENDWVLINAEQVGYFRVNYDEQNWKLILWQLRHNFLAIPPLNRLQILQDVTYFARKGKISHPLALDIFSYFAFEKDTLVLEILQYKEVDMFLKSYENAVSGSPLEDNWKEFLNYTLTPIFILHLSNWAKEERGKDLKESRMYYINALCRNGFKNCLDGAREVMENIFNGKSLTERRFIAEIGCSFIQYGNRDDWEKVLKFESENEYEKRTLLGTLGCTTDRNLMRKFVNQVWNPKMSFRCTTTELWLLVFEQLKENWASMPEIRVAASLYSLVATMRDSDSCEKMKTFFEEIKGAIEEEERRGLEESIKEECEEINKRKDILVNIGDWLRERQWTVYT